MPKRTRFIRQIATTPPGSLPAFIFRTIDRVPRENGEWVWCPSATILNFVNMKCSYSSSTWQLCPTPKIWLEWTFWFLLKELASAKPAKLLLESSPQKEYLCLQGLQNNHQTGEVYLTFISLDIHLQDNSGWGYGGKKVLKRDGIHPFLRTRPRLLFWPC